MEPTPAAPRGTYAPQVTRAVWPDPLFDEDLRLVLGLTSPGEAEALVLREGIPHLRVGGRMAVRASALAAWLDAREVTPRPPTPGSKSV